MKRAIYLKDSKIVIRRRDNMEFKIESKIPVDETAVNLGPKPTRVFYPFGEMEVGNSFSVQVVRGKTAKQIQKSLYYCVRNFQKKNPKAEFKIAIQDKEVRVWRTA
jgi:hypothetical protein